QHEAERAPAADELRAEYLVFRNSLRELANRGAAAVRLHALGREAPWEREREARLLRQFLASQMRRLETPWWQIADEPDPLFSPHGWCGSGITRAYCHERARTPWVRAVYLSTWGTYIGNVASPRRLEWLARKVCDLRAGRLRVALLLYQAEQGKVAAKLDDL